MLHALIFLITYSALYFLHGYEICMIKFWNAMIHRFFKEYGLLVVIDSNVSLV